MNGLGTSHFGILSLFAGAALALLLQPPAAAQSDGKLEMSKEMPKLEQLLSGVVRIKTFINPDGRTIENLGRERSGSGVVIDNSGLIVTIGYLMVEAHSAEIETQDGRKI